MCSLTLAGVLLNWDFFEGLPTIDQSNIKDSRFGAATRNQPTTMETVTGYLPKRLITRCYLCGGKSLELLPQLPGGRSAISDGHLLAVPLQKYQCLDCKLIQSDPNIVLKTATFSYEATYDFYAKPLMRAFEKERYQNYANWVASFLDQCRPSTVLEIGCGEGWVLEGRNF